MLFDSHSHLPEHLDLAKQLVESAKSEGITKIVNIGTDISSSIKAYEIAQQLDGVYASCSVYPHNDMLISLPDLESELDLIINNSDKNKLVAIGECGIDVSEWQGGRTLQEQISLFEMQIELSIKYKLPLIIHNRNGDEIILKTLKKYSQKNIKGVIHCFTSDWETAKKFLDMDFYISFTAFITYPSRSALLDTVKNVPLDRFLIETDSPYILPHSLRKKANSDQNEPKNVKIVAQKVAEVKALPFETICEKSFANTCRLFNIKP